MTQMTDINELRLTSFITEYVKDVTQKDSNHIDLFVKLKDAVDWLGAMHNRTVIKFYQENTAPHTAFRFFAKYHRLHEDLGGYLALINFIRKHTKHFDDDSMDELNHNLAHYKVYKTHGMVFLMSRLKTYGFDIVDVDFSDFVKLNHTLQNPVL